MTKKRDNEKQRKAEDVSGFLREFQGESDRGCALLGAALLDEYLRQLLTAFMVDEPSESNSLISGAYSPLSSFNARTQASFCLGLIGPGTKADLDIIRGIRNDFAHSLHGLSFDEDSISGRCKNLKFPNIWKLGPGIANSARSQFILSVAIAREHIDMEIWRIRRDPQQRRQVKSDQEAYIWDAELEHILRDSLEG